MKDLSPAARELVESHKRDRLLTDAARARIKQDLMLRVSTVATTTLPAGTAAGMSLTAKVFLVALGVTGVVGAASVSVRALRSPAPGRVATAETSVPKARDIAAAMPATSLNPPVKPMAPPPAPDSVPVSRPMSMPARGAAAAARVPAVTVAPVSVRAPRPATTPVVLAAPASAGSVDPGRRDHPKRIEDRPVVSAPETPTPPVPRGEAPDPEPELRALREARDDLRAGRPASAYRRLEEFNRHNPGGMLAQERSALSAIALCQAQPGREAQARAAEFLRRSPESPLAARVKSACTPREPGQNGSP